MRRVTFYENGGVYPTWSHYFMYIYFWGIWDRMPCLQVSSRKRTRIMRMIHSHKKRGQHLRWKLWGDVGWSSIDRTIDHPIRGWPTMYLPHFHLKSLGLLARRSAVALDNVFETSSTRPLGHHSQHLNNTTPTTKRIPTTTCPLQILLNQRNQWSVLGLHPCALLHLIHKDFAQAAPHP